MKKTGIVVLLCAAAFASASAHAGKWGTAGCGVGSMAFQDQPGKIQIVAATINAMFYQSSSITSGTSNCTEMSNHEEAMLYINVNQEALAKDISRGSGDTLNGLAKLMKCSNTDELGTALQRNYHEIFNSNSASDSVAHGIESTILHESSLKASCGLYS